MGLSTQDRQVDEDFLNLLLFCVVPTVAVCWDTVMHAGVTLDQPPLRDSEWDSPLRTGRFRLMWISWIYFCFVWLLFCVMFTNMHIKYASILGQANTIKIPIAVVDSIAEYLQRCFNLVDSKFEVLPMFASERRCSPDAPWEKVDMQIWRVIQITW